MRAFFLSSLCSLLVLGTMSLAAVAAGGHVTIGNNSGKTAVVYLHHDGKEIGRGIVHTAHVLTINTPVDPTGGNVIIELTRNGTMLCRLNGSITSATTRWLVTAKPAATSSHTMPVPCALQRG